MAAHTLEFTVRYSGAATDDNTIRAIAFGTSIGALDELYVGFAKALGAAEPVGLRFVANARRGSVISQFIASDEFRRAVGPVVQNTEILLAIKVALEVVKSGIALGFNIPISLERYRKALAERKRAEHQRDAASYEAGRKKARLDRDLSQRQVRPSEDREILGGRRDLDLVAPSVRFINSVDGQIALRQFIDPLIRNDAGVIELDGPDDHRVVITSEEAQALRGTAIAGLRAAATAAPAVVVPGPTQDIDVVLTVITPRLNGQTTGWYFHDGSRGFSARVKDAEFLNRVKAGKITFAAGHSVRVLLRRAVDERARRFYEILHVYE